MKDLPIDARKRAHDAARLNSYKRYATSTDFEQTHAFDARNPAVRTCVSGSLAQRDNGQVRPSFVPFYDEFELAAYPTSVS